MRRALPFVAIPFVALLVCGAFVMPALASHTSDPEDCIEGLVDDVDALVTANVLSSTRGSSLIRKLEDALELLDRERETGVAERLRDFISLLNAYVKGEILSSNQAQPLIDDANECIDLIQAP